MHGCSIHELSNLVVSDSNCRFFGLPADFLS